MQKLFFCKLKRLKHTGILIMQISATEGIILGSYPFRDYDQILTLFTQERGIVKCIFQREPQKTNKSIPEKLCMPLTK